MDTSRLLRTSGAVAATAALLLSGAAMGGSSPRASAAVPSKGRGEGVAWSDAAQAGRGAPYVGAGASYAGSATTYATGPSASAPGRPLAPLPAEVPSGLRPYYAQKLTWRPCGTSGFECATLIAPLDYDSPRAADDVKLAVSRKKATGPGKRLGSLLVNPGGPGGSAVGYLQRYAALGYPAPVRARYDMVGMDPRGVAGSEPIVCLSDAEMDAYTQVDQTPDDAGETGELVDAYIKFAEGCEARSGKLLGHVSTVEAARDMDVLRAVLGDEKLTYVGASYGTFLGATYAGLFPARVGRLVLDGALDPSLDSERVNRDQTAGFQTAFTAFAEDCARHKDCPLGTTTARAAGDRLAALFKQIDAHPLPAAKPRKLTESLATTGVISAMYDEAAWGLLRSAIRAAAHGDGAPLLRLSDAYFEREGNGAYANLMYANAAVNCLDLPPAFRSPGEVRDALPAFEKASPVFGASLAWAALTCGYWTVPATGRPHLIPAHGADPILVVGTTRDPATPYPWARALASQLSSGRLLTYDGDGHTAYTRGSACIDNAVNGYLLTTTTPPASQKCT
ncbi:alpha/beta hydrolase [Streptomyces albireticuli]|uniref:Proteinase n=1 Tax=Streptomyces albireticuli TaxID=1940 RepID=A0A2A2CZ08_9ACTN|nr:alpha/beta hydrolase [Streptomyces albireticuli]MCD9145214.1 alpha/beta hydrolase [Streptomyces albireticuli]MCD9164611.1 alpha/beta hydrolase [Streptomyces albireticuli]MCD9194876.1 alpha/beta hydrolase [Streptomyces albireticuli]PAU45448.1 proteinase [Streptomyces albireticuli]